MNKKFCRELWKAEDYSNKKPTPNTIVFKSGLRNRMNYLQTISLFNQNFSSKWRAIYHSSKYVNSCF
jgi:hypothetical protein